MRRNMSQISYQLLITKINRTIKLVIANAKRSCRWMTNKILIIMQIQNQFSYYFAHAGRHIIIFIKLNAKSPVSNGCLLSDM